MGCPFLGIQQALGSPTQDLLVQTFLRVMAKLLAFEALRLTTPQAALRQLLLLLGSAEP